MQTGETIRSGLAEIELRAPVKSITEVELEARAAGLSYGKYLYGYVADAEMKAWAEKRKAEIAAWEESHKGTHKDTHKGGRRCDKGWLPRKGATAVKPVVRVGLDGSVLERYESISAAARSTGQSVSSVHRACQSYETQIQKGKLPRRNPSGFRWRYADEA